MKDTLKTLLEAVLWVMGIGALVYGAHYAWVTYRHQEYLKKRDGDTDTTDVPEVGAAPSMQPTDVQEAPVEGTTHHRPVQGVTHSRSS